MGKRNSRAPVASKTALAMAAPVVTMGGSPHLWRARGVVHQDHLDVRHPGKSREGEGVEVAIEYVKLRYGSGAIAYSVIRSSAGATSSGVFSRTAG